MRRALIEVGAVAIVSLYAAGFAALLAWLTILPSIGLLWSIGWLK